MRVVLTGGPHAGKSTLLEALARRGVRTVPEAAIREIRVLVERYGAEEARRRRRADMRAFQVAVSRRQVEAEAEVARYGGLVFFDRGLVDGLAYCAHYGFEPPQELSRIAAGAEYDLCVVCDLVLPFADRSATGRTSDEEAARRLERLVAEAYRAQGVPVLRLPVADVERRADLLLEMTQVATVPAVAAR